MNRRRIVVTADLAGTFVFAIEGALAAIAARFDALGVLVLAFVTALGGGLMRDVLIGAVPPNAVRDLRYPSVALAAGAVTFCAFPLVAHLPRTALLTLDAAGLALFAVAGTDKALVYSIHPAIAVLLGGVTAVGGGTLRDVLLAKVPDVLHVDVYATAALVGGAVMVGAQRLGVTAWVGSLAGGAACFALRMVAIWQHWNLPIAPGS